MEVRAWDYHVQVAYVNANVIRCAAELNNVEHERKQVRQPSRHRKIDSLAVRVREILTSSQDSAQDIYETEDAFVSRGGVSCAIKILHS